MKLGERYIFVFGGLGNQLFQFAFAHLISESTKGHVKLVDATGRIRVSRKFELDILLSRCSHRVSGSALPIFSIAVSKILNIIYRKKKFINILLSNRRNTQSIPKFNFGQYQEMKFIAPVEDSILSELREVLTKIQNSRPHAEMKGVNVGIHIRRGDYDRQHHGHLSINYYKKILDKLEYDSILIHTDDIDLARRLRFIFPTAIIYGPAEATPWEVLADLASSSLVITANSTLSWWGAWLSVQNGGKAFLPICWFRDGSGTPPLNIDGFTLQESIWD